MGKVEESKRDDSGRLEVGIFEVNIHLVSVFYRGSREGTLKGINFLWISWPVSDSHMRWHFWNQMPYRNK